ncbi:MAG: hypothetical protein AAGK17_06290 [Pseudomonadota bacterium]
MTTEFSQNHISEITEISDRPSIFHFGASLGWGTVIGTAALLIVAAVDAGFGLDAKDIGAGIAFFGFFVGLFTVLSMIFIGLPITFLLRVTGYERAAIYSGLGAIAGFAVLAVLFEAPRLGEPESLLMPFAGALAGFSCALRWGMWREKAALSGQRARQQDPKEPPGKRANRIHDLLF